MSKAKIEIKAVIPCGQYQNIQPCIAIDVDEGETVEGNTLLAMDWVKEFVKNYSEHGALPEVNAIVKLKSFNEEGIELDYAPVPHIYTYNGQKLVSATEFTGNQYKEFNSSAIAKTCAKSWDVDEAQIIEMWSANGDLAASLGTLIHAALEHYDRHFAMGEKIKAKNGKDNPAMPKHPLLKKIIEEFQLIDNERGDGKVEVEVLLTDVKNLLCSRADRIIVMGEKRCRIQDYKINVDSAVEDKNSKALAPFDKLPANKLTKYAIQLNFERQLLEQAGWTVEGMDIYAYEDGWKYYSLPVIEVFPA